METRDTGPEGIGGWLILPAFAMVVSPMVMMLQLWRDLVPSLDKDIWNALTNPASEAYHPMWGTLIVSELLMNTALIALTLYVAWQFFSRSPKLPGLYTIWLLAMVAVQGVDLMLVKSSGIAILDKDGPNVYRDFFRAVISALIWIPYFQVSERVRNTFAERAPARKPMGHSVFDETDGQP